MNEEQRTNNINTEGSVPFSPRSGDSVELLAYLFESSKKIVKRRYEGGLFAFVVGLIVGAAVIFFAVDSERQLNAIIFLGILEVCFLMVAYINYRNRNLEGSGYRTFNRVCGLIAKFAFFMMIIETFIKLVGLLNPYRGLDRNAKSAGSVLLDSALDVTITLPVFYKGFKSSEVVEEYFKLKNNEKSPPFA